MLYTTARRRQASRTIEIGGIAPLVKSAKVLKKRLDLPRTVVVAFANQGDRRHQQKLQVIEHVSYRRRDHEYFSRSEPAFGIPE